MTKPAGQPAGKASDNIPSGESLAEVRDWNAEMIREFRAGGGEVGGIFAKVGATLLLLTTTGARSGKQYTTPLALFRVAGRMLVTGSNFGKSRQPAWYHNVLSNPDVTVEIGSETHRARAVVITGDERDRLFAAVAEAEPSQGEYQKATTRTIPVVEISLCDGS